MKTPAKKEPTASEKERAARSAAGKKGMRSRWGKKRAETVTVRAYKRDAAKLRAMAPTTAEAIRQLMEGADGAAPAGRRQA